MNYVGIDLHKAYLVASTLNDEDVMSRPMRIDCRDVARILKYFSERMPYKAVIEASSSYRWLYDLLTPMGQVILAHPLLLRAIVVARAKTDKLDSKLLAKLLKANIIPEAYVPPERYQFLRDVTRGRAKLVRESAQAGNEITALLGRKNLQSPYSNPFCKRGLAWISRQELGYGGDLIKRELLTRLEYYQREIDRIDKELLDISREYPETEALAGIHGIAMYSALLVIAEIGEPGRFGNAQQVGAYAGLTARVNQSGGPAHTGGISRQGSPWLRWILVQAAIKVVKRDEKLGAFYMRVRRRSGVMRARVAVARKLAGICWLRLRIWHRQHRLEAA